MSDEDELVVKLFALATYAEKANHWTDDKRLMDAAGVADAIHEGIDRIEELEAKLEKVAMRREAGMGDEELIRMFRNDPTWLGRDIADRIEALVKERDEARTAREIEAATAERFAERHEWHLVMGAEARARAEAAEAKLRHYKKEVVETAEANEAYAYGRIEELEGQLAKAVEALEHAKLNLPHPDQLIDDTLAELTGGKDD